MDFTNRAIQSPEEANLGCGGSPSCGTLPDYVVLKLQPPILRQENAKVVQLQLSRGKYLHSHR